MTQFFNYVFIICPSKVKDRRNLDDRNDDSYLEGQVNLEGAEQCLAHDYMVSDVLMRYWKTFDVDKLLWLKRKSPRKTVFKRYLFILPVQKDHHAPRCLQVLQPTSLAVTPWHMFHFHHARYLFFNLLCGFILIKKVMLYV